MQWATDMEDDQLITAITAALPFGELSSEVPGLGAIITGDTNVTIQVTSLVPFGGAITMDFGDGSPVVRQFSDTFVHVYATSDTFTLVFENAIGQQGSDVHIIT